MSSSNEKTDLLFKASLGFPSTNKDYEFFQEAEKFGNYTLGEDIFIDDIPSNPDFVGGDEVTYTLADTTNISGVKDISGVVMKFENLKLSPISSGFTDSTSGAWNCLDSSDNNLLKDALQFNYKKDATGYQPYAYTIYNGSKKIVPSNGSWIFDIKSGVVKFYGLGKDAGNNNIDNATDLVINFYKYVLHIALGVEKNYFLGPPAGAPIAL